MSAVTAGAPLHRIFGAVLVVTVEVVVPTVEALGLDPHLLSIRPRFGPLGLAAVLAVHVHEVLRFGCCQQALGLARRRAQPGGACPRGARVGLNATRLRCGDFHTNRDFSQQGTREILLNPAFSVQNSLVLASGSLLLYLAQVNPAGTIMHCSPNRMPLTNFRLISPVDPPCRPGS